MKFILATAAVALFSTAAIAELSTKEQDLRLDTSEYGTSNPETSDQRTDGSILDGTARAQSEIDTTEPETGLNFSTRNDLSSPGQGYPYGG